MDDVVSVKVRKSQRDFGDVELGHRLVEEAVDTEQGLQVAPDEVLHDEEDVVGRL